MIQTQAFQPIHGRQITVQHSRFLNKRNSTDDKTSSLVFARQQLERVCKAAGWFVVAVYEDAGISGSKGRDQRPGFDALLKDAVTRKFDLIAAWSVDRPGRSLQDLVGFLNEIHGLGVDLYLHTQALDSTTPMGRAMFQLCGVFAEFERAIGRERSIAGQDRARAQGRRLGRPPVPPIKVAKIRRLREDGKSIRAAAKMAGVSVGSAHKIISDSRAGVENGRL